MKAFQIKTDGKGLWSSKAKTVECNDLEVIKSSKDFGELRVYFDTDTWSTSYDGLIYTDKTFLKELKDHLKTLGFDDKSLENIGYSEQGMQGDDYVSLDVDGKFMKKFKERGL